MVINFQHPQLSLKLAKKFKTTQLSPSRSSPTERSSFMDEKPTLKIALFTISHTSFFKSHE